MSVELDGVNNILKTDTISEVTSANGVTVDGLSIKDSKLVTANSVIEANMSANSVDSDSYVDGSIDTAHIANDQITAALMADNSIDSDMYVDGSIDTAHLADGQVTIGKLSTAVLTGATDIGAAIVDADLLLVDDGAGGTLRKTTASRLKTYIGAGANAPYFAARRSNTGLAVANDTYVTIVFDTEILDSAGTYNPSDGLWTPGTAGKYFVFANVCFAVNAGTDWDSATIIIDKNSAGYTDTNNKASMAHITRRSGGSSTDSFYVSQIFDLDDNDTVRVQFQGGWSGASSNETVGYGKTYFGGYKLA